MNALEGIHVIKELKNIADRNGLSLVIVGSIGYRDAILDPSQLEKCDDIDCIFIYKNLEDMRNIPYISKRFYSIASEMIQSKKADMISNKFYLGDIQISADYVSENYLKKLSEEKIIGNSKYRKKITDSNEKENNIYRNFWGQEIVYNKPCEVIASKYRIYTLPIHYFVEEKMYPGVLLNKYLYNPQIIYDVGEHEQLIKRIQIRIQDYCEMITKISGNNAQISKSLYKSEFVKKYVIDKIEGDMIG